ncbi:MAG: TonB-dependent receptor plug domain-containing protein [Bacteroidales bacterium]|nr:TonB-dependent receptor plug domain-containing protein [Bacteroidales bacterium]
MKNNPLYRFLKFSFLSLVTLSFIWVDTTTNNIAKINNAFVEYIENVHTQKIYIHLDKEKYFAGETIWFKAYLFEGVHHTFDTLSDHLYIELINPFEQVVQTLRIKIESGTGNGEFILHDTIPEGLYQIRSYTNWMKNFNSQFYFVRNIRIMNSLHKYLITPKKARYNKKYIRKREKNFKNYQADFFPEGGNLIENINCRIGFKVADLNGTGCSAKGVIKSKNSKKNVFFQTEFNGLGAFYLTPLAGEKYTAYLELENGTSLKIPLPEAVKNTIGLCLTETGDTIRLTIRSNKPLSNDRPTNEMIIIGHVRGKLYYSSSVNLLDNDTILEINNHIFPSGVVHFTLFNNRLFPTAERLHFINHGDFINFSVKNISKPDSIELIIHQINPSDQCQQFSGSVSVVLDQNNQISSPGENIITELLLTSDLPGRIQNPSSYIQSNDKVTRKHCDLLMLTHGWKRFLCQDVIEKKFPEKNFEFEEGITISGTITRDIFEFPIENANVRLFILDKYNDEYLTYTNKKGLFVFNDLAYYDTIRVKIIARKQRGGKNLLINIYESPADDITEYFGTYFLTTTSELDKKAYRRIQNEKSKKQMIEREKALDSIYSNSIHGKPDYVLWGNEIPSGYSNLLSAIQGRIPGVSVVGNHVTIRGVNSILSSTEPLLLLDGVPTAFETINSIPVEDVDRIEVLKGPSTSIYGSRGANGVIAVYTLKGSFSKRGEIAFSILGYHTAEKFHFPSDADLESRIENNRMPVTIYWNPNLTLSDKVVSIKFPLHNNAFTKTVIIEGADQDGRPGFAFFKL